MNTTTATIGKVTGALVGMALIAGLSACASSAATTASLHTGTPAVTASPATSSTPVASSTPAPVATTQAPAAVANGAALTADQAKALPEGTVAYKLADGSLIAVVHGQPFPEAVVADVNKVANTTFAAGVVTVANGDNEGFNQQRAAFNTWISSTAHAIGGGTIIVVVDYSEMRVRGTVAPGQFWVEVQNNFANTTSFKSQAAALAAANADAAKMAPALVVTLGR